MDFEWDEEKRRANFAKHGIDLLDAAFLFEGEVLRQRDDRQDYGEERYIAIGMVGEECLVAVYTVRESRIRLISVRRGGRRDRKKYQASIAR